MTICVCLCQRRRGRAAFGNDFNPDNTLNGAIALAARATSQPSYCAHEGVFACPLQR